MYKILIYFITKYTILFKINYKQNVFVPWYKEGGHMLNLQKKLKELKDTNPSSEL